jgi:Mce-associated membrane protein
VLKLDDADMANNDVAVAPRLQRVPGKKDHRKTRERGLRVGRPSYPVASLTLLAVLLAAAAGYLGWSLHNDSEATAERASILTAAQQEAAALTTLSSTTGSKDYDAVLAGSAGDLKQQLSAGRKQFLKTLGTAGVSSVGTVLDAGIVSVKSGTATVLIDVKASVRNKQTAKPEQRAYHWNATLVSSDGKWLVTSLEFV